MSIFSVFSCPKIVIFYRNFVAKETVFKSCFSLSSTVLCQNASKEVNTWFIIVNGLGRSHDQQTKGKSRAEQCWQKLALSMSDTLEPQLKRSACDAKLVVEPAHKVCHSFECPVRDTLIKSHSSLFCFFFSFFFCVFTLYSNTHCPPPQYYSKLVATSSRANSTECTQTWAWAPTSTTSSTISSRRRRRWWTWASASRSMYYRWGGSLMRLRSALFSCRRLKMGFKNIRIL